MEAKKVNNEHIYAWFAKHRAESARRKAAWMGLPPPLPVEEEHALGSASIENSNALECYSHWPAANCIISDGPYGLGSSSGEPRGIVDLAQWYAPHIAAWHANSTGNCTLWLWTTHEAWTVLHPLLKKMGWEYQDICTWDKGLAHNAGRCNPKTIRTVPEVTEISVRYTKRSLLPGGDGSLMSVQAWVRAQWLRSGLPLNDANKACDVRNAASRKYLTQADSWYRPPGTAIERMAAFCLENGQKTATPYFSLDGKNEISAEQWDRMRPRWNHAQGLTNVWSMPAVRGNERIRNADGKYAHPSQKPLALMRRQIELSTEEGDVIWEPFGGLCTASVAAIELNRTAFASEIVETYCEIAANRIEEARK
jgi:site-specific DNA-methyltransferase (adenine-specific)